MSDFIREKRVEAGGIDTHFWEAGMGEPLVLIHGGGPGIDAWGNWQYMIHALAMEGFRVLAPDIVGFGRTEPPSPDSFAYTRERLVQHVVDFVETMELDEPSVVGQSFGGSLSFGLAIDHPELIDRLVVLGPSGRHVYESTPEGESNADKELDRDDMIEFAHSMSATGNVDFAELVDRRLETWERPGIQAAHRAIWKMVESGGLTYDDETLAEIPHETLIIHGKDDIALDTEYSWHYLNTIDRASLYILTGAGHWEMIDQANEVATMVTRFVKK